MSEAVDETTLHLVDFVAGNRHVRRWKFLDQVPKAGQCKDAKISTSNKSKLQQHTSVEMPVKGANDSDSAKGSPPARKMKQKHIEESVERSVRMSRNDKQGGKGKTAVASESPDMSIGPVRPLPDKAQSPDARRQKQKRVEEEDEISAERFRRAQAERRQKSLAKEIKASSSPDVSVRFSSLCSPTKSVKSDRATSPLARRNKQKRLEEEDARSAERFFRAKTERHQMDVVNETDELGHSYTLDQLGKLFVKLKHRVDNLERRVPHSETCLPLVKPSPPTASKESSAACDSSRARSLVLHKSAEMMSIASMLETKLQLALEGYLACTQLCDLIPRSEDKIAELKMMIARMNFIYSIPH